MGRLQQLATGTTEGHINLAGKFTTDKVEHGYLPYYERHLPKTVSTFCEVGVWMGEGLRLFREYYNGKGEFHAIDYWGSTDIEYVEHQLKSEGFITHKGSDDDPVFLRSIKEQFDVVVEDASHHSDSQVICFKEMFVNNVKPGGWYIVEDLVCCNEEFWWRGKLRGFENTLLALLKKYQQEVINNGVGSLESQFITAKESAIITSLIAEIHIENGDDPIAFIKKR